MVIICLTSIIKKVKELLIMSTIKDFIPTIIYVILGIIAAYLVIFKLLGLRVIGTNEVGIVE